MCNGYAFLHWISWDPYNEAEDPEISAAHKQQLSADQRKRNEVEGCFGSGKRKYSFDLMMARLPKGVENLDRDGVSRDVRRENPEAPPTLFCQRLCLVL